MPATLLSQVPRGDAFFPLPPPADSHSSACWPELLKKLRDAPCVTVGTPQQLVEYQTFVYRCIEKVAEGIGADSTWADCNDVLLEPCRRALELVAAGKTSRGRAVAVGLIGLANLSEQLKVATANLPNSGMGAVGARIGLGVGLGVRDCGRLCVLLVVQSYLDRCMCTS